MADIFISYSSEDKTNVKLMAELLEQQGWTVWWDRQIPIGGKFDTVIEEELAKAHCVIVVWTHRSVRSEWVKNEASEASQAGKLVPVMLEEVALPLAFKRTEAALLMDWNGEPEHPELELLFNAVSQAIEKNKTKKDTGSDGLTTNSKTGKKKERKIGVYSPSRYIAIAIAGFIVAAFSIFYYLQFIKAKPGQPGFYFMLILFGLAAGALVYGIMNAYTAMKNERPAMITKWSGPALGLLLIVLGTVFLSPDNSEKTITIRVFDKKKNAVTQGFVKVYLKEYIREQSIDKMGQALFTGIPDHGIKDKIKIEVSSPGYASRQFDTVLNRSSTLELTLPHTAVVFITGKITTAADNPIRNVEVNVDGTRYVAYTINNGDYNLRLEEYTLGDEITLTTSHQDFEDKTKAIRINSPEIKGVDFVLNPINH